MNNSKPFGYHFSSTLFSFTKETLNSCWYLLWKITAFSCFPFLRFAIVSVKHKCKFSQQLMMGKTNQVYCIHKLCKHILACQHVYLFSFLHSMLFQCTIKNNASCVIITCCHNYNEILLHLQVLLQSQVALVALLNCIPFHKLFTRNNNGKDYFMRFIVFHFPSHFFYFLFEVESQFEQTVKHAFQKKFIVQDFSMKSSKREGGKSVCWIGSFSEQKEKGKYVHKQALPHISCNLMTAIMAWQ